jgi:hypothetical protein
MEFNTLNHTNSYVNQLFYKTVLYLLFEKIIQLYID